MTESFVSGESNIDISQHRVTVGKLLKEIGEAFKALVRFLLIAVLVILWAVLRVLPYLLRVASVMLWAVSMFLAFVAVASLYIRFSDWVVSILTGIITVCLVALIPSAFLERGGDVVWGGYFSAGLVGLIIKVLADWLAQEAQLYAFVSVLPSVLAIVCLILILIRKQEVSHVERLDETAIRKSESE